MPRIGGFFGVQFSRFILELGKNAAQTAGACVLSFSLAVCVCLGMHVCLCVCICCDCCHCYYCCCCLLCLRSTEKYDKWHFALVFHDDNLYSVRHRMHELVATPPPSTSCAPAHNNLPKKAVKLPTATIFIFIYFYFFSLVHSRLFFVFCFSLFTLHICVPKKHERNSQRWWMMSNDWSHARPGHPAFATPTHRSPAPTSFLLFAPPAARQQPVDCHLCLLAVFTFAYVNLAPGKLHTFRLYQKISR